MLFITGLLALLAFSNAGGEHHIKGGGHIKGGDSHHSGSTQQQVVQEVIAPSPYSFNIDTSASYGSKIFREETGDAEGRVKGSYTIGGPRGTTRVVQYTADETGFHANVKTSEPNIETHSPANARIEAVSKKGGSASVLIPIPAEVAVKKSGFAAPDALLRDPIALPVANQPAITAVKTVKTLTSASGPQTIKTVDKSLQPVVIVSEKKSQPVKVTTVRKGAGDILPGALGTGGQKISDAREVIVYDDGTIVDVGSVSGNAGTSNLQPLLGGISSGPILKAGGQLAGGTREVIVYEDGTIEEVGHLGQGATKSAVYTGENAKDVSFLTTVQKPAIRTVPKPDLKIQRRPTATVARPGSGIQAVSVPKPILPVQTIQSGLDDNIRQINRDLIQRQNKEGVLQTFGGVAKSESDLAGLPVSLEQLGGFGTVRPVAPPVIQLKKPSTLTKPQLPKPSVTSAANRGESFKYTGSRVTSGILGSSAPRVIPGQLRVVQTQGYNNQFLVGNTAGLSGSSDDIKLINRQLIQRQNKEGVLQTFGSVAKSESDLTGLPVSLEQLGGYGTSRPVAPAIQLRQPVTLTKPKVPKPTVTSADNRGQTFKYTGSRVTSGILGSSAPLLFPGQTRVAQNQWFNNQFVVGNSAGSIGSSGDIKLINRQLIQRQNDEGVLQAFGGVVKSESDLTGLPVSLEQLGAYGVNRPIAPTIQLRKPVEIAKPKPFKPVVASTAGQDQSYKYASNRVSSGILGSSFPQLIPGQITGSLSQIQGYNNQFVVGNAAGPINLNDEIKIINRQLIQRQNEEGILQTFGGVVKSEADLTGLPVSLEQFGSYGGNQPISPTIQLRQPVPITKPRQSNRIILSNAGRDQIFKQISPTKPNIPSQGVSQAGLSDNIKLINQQLIQKQANEGFAQTFGGIVKSDSDIGRVSITGDQVRGLTQLSGYNTNKPVVPSSQSAAGLEVITTADQYTAPRPAPVATPARAALVPKPKAPAQILPQSYDILTLNRNLIQKQNEQGVLQAFGGIAKSEDDLDGISVSLEQLGDLSQSAGYGSNVPQTPQAPKRPVNVVPKRPSLTSSQASRPPTATRIDQSAQEFGIRTSGVQTFAPARIGPQNALTASRTSSGNQRTATRTSSGLSTTSSGGNADQISGTSSAFGSSGVRQVTYSQGGVSGDLVNINRQLIEKQNREGIQQAFGGIIKSEADLEDGLVYVDELDAITKLVGYNTAGDQGPQSYAYSSGQRVVPNQAQEAAISLSPLEQSRIATGLIPAGSPDIQIASQAHGGQLQVKIDDIAEPSSLSRGKDSSTIPSIQSSVSETFKQVDLQENIPVEIQSYVPPMSPYNYRTQIRASSSDSQNVQEQQKIEQIFV